MDSAHALDAGREFILVTLKLSLPILLPGLIVGILVSIFQAATQIQEFTLTFVPKLLVIITVLVVLGSWMLSTMVAYITHTFSHMGPVLK